MHRLTTVLALAAACSSLTVTAAEPPRLIVMVVVDGFRADYLTSFAAHWRAGMATMLRDGAQFRRAQLPYLQTDTCAGHATISTGTMPRTHGMIADNWWDRDGHEDRECTRDAATTPVTYDRPARIGNSGRWLRVPTLADRLRSERPGSRVVTLSLKARAAISLAGRGGDAVTWFEDAAGSFVTSTAFAAAPVPAVKQFMSETPYAKALGTTWTLRDAPEKYRNGDAGVGERPPAGWTGLLPHTLLGEKGADDRFAAQWRRSPASDAYLGQMARTLIDSYRLGRGTGTDYLGISFSAPDYVAHSFGPESRELEDILAHLDDVLGDLIRHLDANVGRDAYVLAFSADHGMPPIPSAANGTGRVAPEDIRDRVEDTLRRRNTAPMNGPYIEGQYRSNLYLSAQGKERVLADAGAVRAVQTAVMAIPGVSRVFHTPALTGSASDAVARAAWLSSAPDRSGDFIVVPKQNWVLSPRGSGNAIEHGSVYDYDRRTPLLFLGAGIRRGVYDTDAGAADIAPTLAALAAVTLPAAEGRVLREALLPSDGQR
jgi:predicted AlkP superfamily pyrophosphatase or phosphodiesterase